MNDTVSSMKKNKFIYLGVACVQLLLLKLSLFLGFLMCGIFFLLIVAHYIVFFIVKCQNTDLFDVSEENMPVMRGEARKLLHSLLLFFSSSIAFIIYMIYLAIANKTH